MKMSKDNNSSRRDVLKTITATGSTTLIGATGVAEADESLTEKYNKGQVLFVEIGMRQSGLDKSNTHTEDSSSHVLEESTLGLRYAPVGPFKKQNIVTSYHRNYHPGGTLFGGQETGMVPVKTGYDWRQARSLLADGFTHPSFEANRGPNQSVSVEVNEQSIDVASGRETEVELEPVEIADRMRDEVVETRPVVTIRNNGIVDVYGSPRARVFPRKSSKSWVRQRMNGYKNNPEVRTEVTREAFAAFYPIIADEAVEIHTTGQNSKT